MIFFNNVGYLGMCGHGTIGLMVSLAYLGRVRPGVHRIETSVGEVSAILHESGEVTVNNVASYRSAASVAVNVPGHGQVRGDVAWGGNWFFLVPDHKMDLKLAQCGRVDSTSPGPSAKHSAKMELRATTGRKLITLNSSPRRQNRE